MFVWTQEFKTHINALSSHKVSNWSRPTARRFQLLMRSFGTSVSPKQQSTIRDRATVPSCATNVATSVRHKYIKVCVLSNPTNRWRYFYAQYNICPIRSVWPVCYDKRSPWASLPLMYKVLYAKFVTKSDINSEICFWKYAIRSKIQFQCSNPPLNGILWYLGQARCTSVP